jgi:hypothetical protein
MEIAMAPVFPRTPDRLPVGSVVEQRQGDRTFLVVQETADRTSIIESWDQGLDLANRLLGRLNQALDDINAGMAASNERLTRGIDETSAKIAANGRLLDEIVKSRP